MIWPSLGPALALDNVLVTVALAPLCRDRARFTRVVAWFAGVEAAATVGGTFLRVGLPEGVGALAPALLLTLGLAVAGLGLVGRVNSERLVGDRCSVPALALLLGLDNLVAGRALGLSGAVAGGLNGGAIVAVAGAAAWIAVQRLAPTARILASGALLVTAAVVAGVA